jgi:DNA processing protein
MANLLHLTPLDPRYPSRLRGLRLAPASLAVQGGSLEADLVVAVVGARKASMASVKFAHKLGQLLAEAGAVVVSGGARGIDGAAHEGALYAKGRTWVVAPTGPDGCFPSRHKALFARVAEGPGAMLWPNSGDMAEAWMFKARNRVLVALADAVVVVQAGARSGALNAAKHAENQRKALWVVQPAPWSKGFMGSRKLLERGARRLTSSHLFLRSLGLAAQTDTGASGRGDKGLLVGPPPRLSPEESAIWRAASAIPEHVDALALRAGTSPQATTAALLTLALENVVVEGPPGFFRRGNAHNR